MKRRRNLSLIVLAVLVLLSGVFAATAVSGHGLRAQRILHKLGVCHGHHCTTSSTTTTLPTTTATTATTATTQTTTTMQTTTTQQTTTATTTTTPPTYLRVMSSLNSEPVGLSSDSSNCTLTHDELGDTFHMNAGGPNPERCTWTNQTTFTQMHRHVVMDLSERFDLRTDNPNSWENNVLLRPNGPYGSGCSGGGNAENMLVTIRIVSKADGDHWQLELRGGNSLRNGDHDTTLVPLDLVQQGQTVAWKFDLVTDYLHGAATVWENGVQVYNNRDRPLGFHFNCTTGDISNVDLRMQHGDYRGWTGPLTLTSSGFGFLVDDPE